MTALTAEPTARHWLVLVQFLPSDQNATVYPKSHGELRDVVPESNMDLFGCGIKNKRNSKTQSKLLLLISCLLNLQKLGFVKR